MTETPETNRPTLQQNLVRWAGMLERANSSIGPGANFLADIAKEMRIAALEKSDEAT